MPNYTAPVEDMMFLYDKLRNNKSYNELEKYKDVNSELVKDILDEAAKINQNLILPLAKAGDENPAILENGVVRTPPGYKDVYSKFIEDGWTSHVIQNMVGKECLKLLVLFLMKCFLQLVYHLNYIVN